MHDISAGKLHHETLLGSFLTVRNFLRDIKDSFLEVSGLRQVLFNFVLEVGGSRVCIEVLVFIEMKRFAV